MAERSTSDVPMDATESVNHSGDDPIDCNDILKSLRETHDFKVLAEHFLKTGRGRRPAIPHLGAPTNKVLLQLFCLKNDGNATWDEVTTWYNKIFSEQCVTRGSLKHRIEMILKSGEINLNEIAITHEVPETLSRVGLSSEILLGKTTQFIPKDVSVPITNDFVSCLENFRSKHKLPHSFVHKWTLGFCPSYTESQMRHKTAVILKTLKQLKARKKFDDLRLFLKENIPKCVADDGKSKLPSSTNTSTNDSVLEPIPCKCGSDKLRQKIEDFEEKNRSAVAVIDNINSELWAAKNKLIELENEKKKNKTLSNQLKKQKRINENKASLLADLKSSKIYKRNINLRKQIQKQNRERRQLNKELSDLKLDFEDKIQVQEQNIADLKRKLKSEQTMKARLRKEKLESSIIFSDLIKENEENTIQFREDKYNQFSDDVRLLYMALMGESNVAAQNCNSVVQNVSRYLFKCNFSLDQLPSISSILNFASEASQIAHCHVVEKIKDSKHFTFATDGTSRQKKHYLEKHIVLDDKLSLSLGYSEVASDNSDTLLEKTIEILDDLSTIYHNTSGQDKDELFKLIVKKMKCIMSDRAAVMKCYDNKLLQFKKDVLEDDECTLQFLFCNAHFLLGLVTSTEKALMDIERNLGKLGRDKDHVFERYANNKECSAFRIIRTASDVFGPRGDEKCGCREEWLAFCKSKDIKSKFTSFRTNRFNNLFENAFAVIYHFQDILTFLNDYVSHNNLKLQSVSKDLQDTQLLSVVASIGFFYKFFTGPYWQLMNCSSVSYGQFPPYVSKMNVKLHQWINEFEITNLDSVFGECFNVNDENVLMNFLLSSRCDQSLLKKSFIEISCQANVVFQRQLADFLEGGVYGGEVSEEIRDVLNSSPLTNLTGERIFGDLDFDLHKRRHASLHLRTTLNMLKRNKTTSWLGQQNIRKRQVLLSAARKNAPIWKLRSKERVQSEREKIKAKIFDNLRSKKDKEIKKMEAKNNILQSILADGGPCTTKKDLDILMLGRNSLTKIRNQIKYRKVILGEAILSTGTLKTLYNRLLERLS